MIEAQVPRPRSGAELRVAVDVSRHQVRELWRVAHHDLVELVALVLWQRVGDGASDELHPADVAGARAPVLLASAQDELSIRALLDREGAAADLLARLRPRIAVRLDRVPWLRSSVRAVHDAHEVRGRGDQAELDRSIVQSPHPDPVGIPIVAQVVVLPVLQHEVDRDR